MEFIERVRGDGKTVIFCSHNMHEIERLCDRIVILHKGQIRGSGTVSSVKSDTGEPTLERAFLKLVDYQPEFLS